MITKVTKKEADKWYRMRKLSPRFNHSGIMYFNIDKDWYKCDTPGALGLKEIWQFRQRDKANKEANIKLFDLDNL